MWGNEGNSVFDGGDGQMNCTRLLKDAFLRDNPQVEVMAFEKIEHGCKPPCTHIPAIILKTSTQQKGEKTHLHLFTLLVCFKIKLPLRRLLTLWEEVPQLWLRCLWLSVIRVIYRYIGGFGGRAHLRFGRKDDFRRFQCGSGNAFLVVYHSRGGSRRAANPHRPSRC